ncbi:hypothetical protein F5Y16DRAFT_368827 [Xylariaceae sp. FL0255]|nr:hypothetical protein F5Y16DRAFT_368827 [Xylariaceae sp. FL0255]
MSESAAITVITNTRVFDGQALLHGTKTVVIENSMIKSIDNYKGNDDIVKGRYQGTSVTIVDGSGCTLLPGLIDTHVHIQTVEQLSSCAVHGVTTVCDMACAGEAYKKLRAISKAGENPTSWLATSLPAYAADSRHGQMFRFLGIGDENALSTADEVAPFVEARVADEVDYVKIIADEPGLSQDVLDAIQSESRKRGLKTVAHTAQHVAFQRGLDAGFDVLTHAPMDEALDLAMAQRMVAQGTVAIPTLAMMEAFKKSWVLWPMYYKRDFSKAVQSVTVMRKAGVMILAGSDANAAPVVSNRHGGSLLRELELLVAAGLTPTETLSAATALPAAYFRLNDRGRVAAGLRADLLLVEGDPTVDISTVRKRRHVWSAGKPVENVQDQSWNCVLM